MKKFITLSIAVCLYAAISAQTTGDYRTIASGYWNNIAIWQRFNGTAWRPATAYPTSSDGAIDIRDGHNVTMNLNITIDETTIDGGGQLTLTSGYSITLNNGKGNDLTVNGLLYTTTGTITGTGNLVINNSMKWDGGTLQVATTNNGHIVIGNSVTLSAVLTNSGPIDWTIGQIVFAGGSIVNNDVISCYSNSTLNNGTGSGTITNNASGTINVNVVTTLSNRITINNKGVINFNSGTLSNDAGLITNSKTMNFDGGYFQNASTTDLNTGTKITGSGIFTLYNNTLNVNAAVTIPAGVNFRLYTSGPILSGSGSLTVNGPFQWLSGTISIPVTINPSGVFSIDNGNVTLSSSITNNGTINWSYGNIYFSGGVITNNKTFNIMSDFQFIQNPSGSVTNSATGIITKSSFGTTTINTPFTNKGTIGGSGTFDFGTNLTNTGTFDPGVGTGTAILTTGTDYTNNKLSIKIKGLSPGQDYDRLQVNGNATLKGTLTVTSTGSVPAGADTILKTTGTISGRFGTVNLPTGYTITYKTNKVIINIPASLTSSQTDANSDAMQSNFDKQFSVFPNPATEYLYFNFQSRNKNIAASIFDEDGKVLYKNVVASGNNIGINVSKLTPGSYVLQLNDGDKVQSAKFIKQ